ncbi:D-erythronate dehydrogenase [Falsiroseomonas selenitidurans]|uniref:NAD-dependent epimerase/dehydratase family protein n=1 Tax=Falsiroseomonas selenitidurans TaxID=2716335 RepID=A0ABX1E1T7_9PROT|nr:D-erythronate dehydrogenase [Falsiroseomonas selenitidurans]NKC30660.1 NAD-dependent epimerase/dehydratase family protein [Falsiroseomonas selenitidurans]
MQVTILGGGGFLGRRLAARLARDGAVGGTPITGMTLFDLHAPAPLDTPFPLRCLGGDVADRAALAGAIPAGTGLVVHLAAVVSAAAEADYDLGIRVNIAGTQALIDTCRTLPAPPRVVFTSSVASFDGGQQAMVPDDARQLPTNSYGAQKAIGELLLADASRRGFLDAVSIRLPTVMVRPGRPNRAASSFVSAIIREPLLGLPGTYPVAEGFRLWICSPRRAVDWLAHAAAMDSAALGRDRGINPPGLSASIGEMLAALEEVAGAETRALARPVPDAEVAAIVDGWPAAFAATRAPGLGFVRSESLAEIIRGFIADDLEATRRDRAAG